MDGGGKDSTGLPGLLLFLPMQVNHLQKKKSPSRDAHLYYQLVGSYIRSLLATRLHAYHSNPPKVNLDGGEPRPA